MKVRTTLIIIKESGNEPEKNLKVNSFLYREKNAIEKTEDENEFAKKPNKIISGKDFFTKDIESQNQEIDFLVRDPFLVN